MTMFIISNRSLRLPLAACSILLAIILLFAGAEISRAAAGGGSTGVQPAGGQMRAGGQPFLAGGHPGLASQEAAGVAMKGGRSSGEVRLSGQGARQTGRLITLLAGIGDQLNLEYSAQITATATMTDTPTSTSTDTPTSTSTATPTASNTPTKTLTPSQTPTRTATNTRVPTSTASRTPFPTAVTPTQTQSPTPTVVLSATPTYTPSPILEPLLTVVYTLAVQDSPTPSITPSPTYTLVPSLTSMGPDQRIIDMIESGNFLRPVLILLVVAVWGISAIGLYIYLTRRNN
ncbi:MAG: hypothetical protein MUO62_04290 [Anaerolineales bacterium]|nr:hypothetical protein [Anaerolineales bacterium]